MTSSRTKRENICDECGLPISICNAKAMFELAVSRNGREAVIAAILDAKTEQTEQPTPESVTRLVEAEPPHAWRDVMDERVRQVEVEGFERQYDDAYQSRDLAAAAACYAMIAGAHRREVFSAPPIGWPWAKSWWKPTDPRRDLVKAGALILAEIERLDRAACKGVRDE